MSSTNATIDNLTSTNLNGTKSVITNMSSTNATIDNLASTTLTSTNLNTIGSLTIGANATSITLGSSSITTFTQGNISSNNLSSNNISSTTGYIGSQLKVGGSDIFNFSSVGYLSQYRQSSTSTDVILDLYSNWSSITKNNVLRITADGSINSSSQITAGSFNTPSDYRIKNNVLSILNTSYNTRFAELNPVYYYNKNNKNNEFGFIAHEVNEIYPELVKGKKDDENGYQNINYIGLIPICVNEIKKLSNQLKQALDRIQMLELKQV